MTPARNAGGGRRRRGRAGPVRRLPLLAGLLLLAAAIAGVVGLAVTLRHPPALVPAPAPADDGDPREEFACPAPGDLGGRAPVQVNSNDLYECPHAYDGRAVRYEGEAVGALLRRGEGVWAQLNDDAYAGDLGPLPAHREFRGGNAGVGVLLPHELAAEVVRVGGPTARGDVLAVVGTFHLSDPESREVAVIRASSGHVARPGAPIDHAPMRDRQVAGALLAAAAALALAAGRLVPRRR